LFACDDVGEEMWLQVFFWIYVLCLPKSLALTPLQPPASAPLCLVVFLYLLRRGYANGGNPRHKNAAVLSFFYVTGEPRDVKTTLSCRFFILGEPQNKNDAPKLGRGVGGEGKGVRMTSIDLESIIR
jgi:hypothetical protein